MRVPTLRAGPTSIRAMRVADLSFWRPRVGEQCAASVVLTLYDLQTGKVLNQSRTITKDGDAVMLDTKMSDDQELSGVLGARASVWPAQVKGLPACKGTFPFRLTLTTTGKVGRSEQTFEAWPCKWYLPERTGPN